MARVRTRPKQANRAPQRREITNYGLSWTAVATSDVDTERERRGRRMFTLLMTGMIQEQLGDGTAAERTREEYARKKEELPPKERALVTCWLDRLRGPREVMVPRVCQVQSRDNEVHVKAVNYPLRQLLDKIASAGGGRIHVPPQVSGVADFTTDGFRGAIALKHLVKGRGLLAHGSVEDGFQIVVRDPLYMASLAQRARGHASKPPAEGAAKGITTGYVIMGGHYVEPPYQVEVRAVKNKGALYLNGVAIGDTYKLSTEPPDGAPKVQLPRRFTLEDQLALAALVRRTYVDLQEEQGHAAALARIGDILADQDIVQSWEYKADSRELFITFVNGDQAAAILYPTRSDRPKTIEEDDIRNRALARLERRKLGIERTLRENGLVVAPTNGPEHRYEGREAREKLRAVRHCLEQTLRHQEQLCAALFDSLRDEAPGWAWELFFNLQHRVLIQRLEAEKRL